MMRCLVVLAAVAPLLSRCAPHAAQAPRFSWGTLPVFYHSANASGQFNATSIATIARYPLVTIEKYQGPLGGAAFRAGQRYEEDNIVAVARALKAVNPSVAVLSYMHRRNYPWYRYAWEMEAQPEWWARDATGTPLTEPQININCSAQSSGPGQPPHCPKTDVHVRDWNNSAAVAAWVSACAGQVAAGMDGCFVDGVCDKDCPVCCDADSGLGHGLADMQAAVGAGVVIANNAFRGAYPKVKGVMMENWQAVKGEGWATMLQQVAQRGTLVQAHVPGNLCPPKETDVAAFLVAAGENSYFGCSAWFESPESGGPHWYPEFYDRPLGAPKGPAVVADKVWRREFASGTSVVMDFGRMTASITWGNATLRGQV